MSVHLVLCDDLVATLRVVCWFGWFRCCSLLALFSGGAAVCLLFWFGCCSLLALLVWRCSLLALFSAGAAVCLLFWLECCSLLALLVRCCSFLALFCAGAVVCLLFWSGCCSLLALLVGAAVCLSRKYVVIPKIRTHPFLVQTKAEVQFVSEVLRQFIRIALG
jgi:hypothetical protein